jgi:hypothetical protein
MKRYPSEETWREIAYLAYHTGWQLDQLLDLQHGDRVRMVRFVADADQRSRELTRDAMSA